MNGSSIVKSPECGNILLHLCSMYQIRSFVQRTALQFVKFSFHFDPLQIIKCLPACHILQCCTYSMANYLHSWWINGVLRLLFGFHSEVQTLTFCGKFCNHQFVLVLCFALNAVWKCSLNITRIILGCIISLLIPWEALYCIKFTCLGYSTQHIFPKLLFMWQNKCFTSHAWRKKRTLVAIQMTVSCNVASCDYSHLYEYPIKTPVFIERVINMYGW